MADETPKKGERAPARARVWVCPEHPNHPSAVNNWCPICALYSGVEHWYVPAADAERPLYDCKFNSARYAEPCDDCPKREQEPAAYIVGLGEHRWPVLAEDLAETQAANPGIDTVPLYTSPPDADDLRQGRIAQMREAWEREVREAKKNCEDMLRGLHMLNARQERELRETKDRIDSLIRMNDLAMADATALRKAGEALIQARDMPGWSVYEREQRNAALEAADQALRAALNRTDGDG